MKLTAYAKKGGCACKLAPQALHNTLQGMNLWLDENVLVDMEYADDGGVYRLTDELALVQTVDFFPPMVDDPYTFGRIAAANSLSDIYAMGGVARTALHVVAFPLALVQQGVLQAVQQGAVDTLREARVALLGGHTIEDAVPKFGLAVTGTVHPQKIWKNAGALPGDALILTKPLGTGALMTAVKGGLFMEEAQAAILSMTRLNKKASEIAARFTVHACTDITGFGLAGHSTEMAKASQVSLHINRRFLPVFVGTSEAVRMGLVPAATYHNRQAFSEVDFASTVTEEEKDICYDPQTSGGLLLAVPSKEATTFLQALQEEDVAEARIIGEVKEKRNKWVYIT